MIELTRCDAVFKKPAHTKFRKADLKIDMTPMVDLGFLLVAFFVFTTEISKPVVARLYMPHDGSPINVSESRSLTILLGQIDELFYYYGLEEMAIKNNRVFRTTFSELTGLGKIIREKQLQLTRAKADKTDLLVLIKPGDQSNYQSLVHTLDEMLINGVTRYVIVDPGSGEKAFLSTHLNR